MSPELLNTIMTAVVLPLLVAVSGYVIAYLRKKAREVSGNIEDKIIRTYVQEANDIVIQAITRHNIYQSHLHQRLAIN